MCRPDRPKKWNEMNIGVIGGGAAGLAAAYETLRQGHQVTVFERAPFLGGQASTFEVGGTPLERGYHHLFTSDVDMIWLIQELGLQHRLAWIESKVALYRDGRIWPFTTPTDLLRFRAIDPLSRLRLGLATLNLRRAKDWRRFESSTAATFLPHWVGRQAYEAVWEPLLRGKFGLHYDQVGMAWFWGKIALRLGSRSRGIGREKLGYPMGSFGEIFDTLAERIRSLGGKIHTQANVRQIVVEDGRAVALNVELPGYEGDVHHFDAIMATVPSYILPNLLPSLPVDYLEKLTKVTYLAAVLLVLTLKHPLTWAYWLNVADRSIPFMGVVEQTNFLSPERYGGKHVVYLANYLGKEDPLYALSHQDLLSAYLPHLNKLNPDFDESWILESYYHREEAAQPLIKADYSLQIPSHRTPFRNLYLANTTQIYPEDRGTNYSVRLGRKVALMVLGDYGHPTKGSLPQATIRDSITSAIDWE
jgi:protoporphyrinogen oxidase